MKQIIGRIVSEVLWQLGDWVYYPMIQFDSSFLYSIYNWLMCTSHDVQVWAGCDGPWNLNEKEELE